jgi:transposase
VLVLGEMFMIHQLHEEWLSIRAIARKTGLDRKTVRKYLRRGLEPPVYGPRHPKPTLIDPYADYLRGRLKAVPDLTARRLLREIQARGFTGSYTTVKSFVRDVRPPAVEGFEHRFETPPGQQAQVDFAYFTTVFDDEPDQVRILWLFNLVLGYSRHMWGRFVCHQNLETFIRCHLLAFEHLGGVPLQMLYDRPKIVVKGTEDGGVVVFHPMLVDLSRHFGFIPRVCPPYRAKTKGKVERPFRYVRQDFFLGGHWRNEDDLNGQYQDWLDQVANRRQHGTTGRLIHEAFEEEKAVLLPLPELPFRTVLSLERRVSRDGVVSIEGNEYSVPDGIGRGVLEVQRLADEIRILKAGQLVAVHQPVEGRGRRVVLPGHRRYPPPGVSRRPRSGEEAYQLIQPGQEVTVRPLTVYEHIGRTLAERIAACPQP